MSGIGSLRVMVVDDNQHMRTILVTILKGFEIGNIIEANDGATALHSVRHCKPDMVFVDINMNPIDGVDFTATIRNATDSFDRELPIIVVSAHSEPWRVEAARDAGATEFLTKPITARRIWDRLQSVVLHPRPFIRTDLYYGPDRRRSKSRRFSGPFKRRSDNHEADQARLI